jgi:hypothetical protein
MHAPFAAEVEWNLSHQCKKRLSVLSTKHALLTCLEQLRDAQSTLRLTRGYGGVGRASAIFDEYTPGVRPAGRRELAMLKERPQTADLR